MKSCILILACLLVGCDQPSDNVSHDSPHLTLKTYDDSQMRSIEADDVKDIPVETPKEKPIKKEKHHKKKHHHHTDEDDQYFPGSPVPGNIAHS